MNIGSVELIVLALSAVLLLIIIAGSSRLKVPRKVSLQGIEDPEEDLLHLIDEVCVCDHP